MKIILNTKSMLYLNILIIFERFILLTLLSINIFTSEYEIVIRFFLSCEAQFLFHFFFF